MLSYAAYFLVADILFDFAFPETWFLLLSFGAPLVWVLFPRFGIPFFVFSHFIWLGATLLPIIIRPLFESDYSLHLTPRHLIFFGFFGAVNLVGMFWLLNYILRRR